MRNGMLVGLIGLITTYALADDPVAARAWFTQAEIKGSAQVAAPPDPLSPVPGTAGRGVTLDRPVAIENPLLKRAAGYLGFWIQPLLERPDMVGPPLADLFDRIARGELRVVVGATYPLAEAAEAQRALSERRTAGKLLLDPTT